MNTNFTYLLVNLGAFIVPFLFSFHPKLQFNKEWKKTIISILIVGTFFIIWDIYYTKIGVWGFNPDYLLGINFFNLPLEEVLFFICIPYACLYTYHCFKKLLKPFSLISSKVISGSLLLVILTIGLCYINNLYTGLTFVLLFFVLSYTVFFLKPIWLPRLYLSLLILIIPFTIVNGILTGTGIETEVVWYNPNEIIGIRFLSIPIEDFFYGFLLILLNVIVFEKK
ncbi:MAG: lycopene cyclase domain-containing protein [Vicingaceae bacterium]|nr:lycopene cyclase domain-containing protein [Vicingaceae bacterium]